MSAPTLPRNCRSHLTRPTCGPCSTTGTSEPATATIGQRNRQFSSGQYDSSYFREARRLSGQRAGQQHVLFIGGSKPEFSVRKVCQSLPGNAGRGTVYPGYSTLSQSYVGRHANFELLVS